MKSRASPVSKPAPDLIRGTGHSWERGHLARRVPLGGLEARAPRHGNHGGDAGKATSETGQSRCRIIRKRPLEELKLLLTQTVRNITQ